MPSLDLEQQLRQREAQRGEEGGAVVALPALSFVHAAYLEAGQDAVLLFGGLCGVAIIVFIASAFLPRTRYANLVATTFQHSGVGLIPNSMSPASFALGMALWMALLATQTVCDVLREVAQQHYAAVTRGGSAAAALTDLSTLHRIPVGRVYPHPLYGMSMEVTMAYPTPLQWIMTPTALLFAAQFGGMVCVWCYMLFLGRPLESGAAASLLPFFATFYKVLLLNGEEPERWPVWVTLVNFFLSLACVWGFCAQLFRREMREVLRQLRGHTAQALYKERPELKDIRARGARNPKQQ